MTLLENRPDAIPAPREITTKPRLSDQIFRLVVTIGGMSSLVILGLIANNLDIDVHIFGNGFKRKNNHR